ncbi:MAG: MATE family efflux transporter [Coprobacillaceae bacterium]
MEKIRNVNHYLGEEKIGKLMLKFSIPCIMSLLVSALYNIVDQIFIGHGIGYLGNGATNVVFPITIIVLAIALLIGDGCAAFLSICQGRNDTDSSNRSVGNAISLTVILSIIFVIIFYVFKENLLLSFGATDGNIGYAREYYDIIVMGVPFFMFSNAMNSIIRADGNPKFAMMSTLVGCIINIILDPIAIFVFNMGMQGAALATILGQLVSAILAIYYIFKPKTFTLSKVTFSLQPAILKKILPLGISSFLTQISIVVIMAVMNNMLVQYGANSKYGADIPLTVVGIVMKVFQIVISIVVGIAAGAQPIVGYNYGAGLYERVKKIFKTMIIAEIVVGAISTICFEFFPMQIISLFGSESALYNEFAVLAFRIYLVTILLCCIQKATSIFLQSLGKPVLSTGLSLLRDFILSVPLVLILPYFDGVTGLLFSAPIADIISFIVVIFVIRYVYQWLNKQMHEAIV